MAEILKNHKAKKRFGQNFLNSDFWIEKIAAAVSAQNGQSIVEIGPGQAALTRELIASAGHISCIEIDRDLATWLKTRFKEDELTVIEADALTFKWESLAEEKLQQNQPLRVVGNLPYNISSPLLFRLAAISDKIRDQHFMLQKEVVDRMSAVPGHKSFGRLSVMLQHKYKITKLFDVPPEAFTPAPKVMSSVVRMVPLSEPLKVNEELFEKVVAASFSMRRKTIKNNLQKLIPLDLIEEAGIDLGARAETISMPTFVRLTNLIEERGINFSQLEKIED